MTYLPRKVGPANSAGALLWGSVARILRGRRRNLNHFSTIAAEGKNNDFLEKVQVYKVKHAI